MAVGLLLAYASERCLSFLAEPEVVVQLVASDSGGKLAVHLVNASEREVKIACGDVRSCLVPVPNTDHEYVIHVRCMTDSGEKPRGMVILPEGDEIVLADVSRHLRSFPSGTLLLLSAVSIVEKPVSNDDATWSGFARSAPLSIRSR